MGYLAKNNAYSTLASGVTSGATTLTVAAGQGDRFPIIASPDYTYITLEDASNNREIVKVTARASGSDSMTIARAQDDTAARAWSTGDLVELRVCNAVLADPTRLSVITEVAAILSASTLATIQSTVAGASGLNADTVDGYHATSLLNTNLIPTSTVMVFYQAAAPTGWTKVTTHTDKVMRVVSGTGGGSGGATAFTSIFGASKTTGSHTLTTDEIPAHTHGAGTLATASNGAHTHDIYGSGTDPYQTPPNNYSLTGSGTAFTTSSNGAHTHTISGSTANNSTAGSGHTHTLSLDLQYVDVIICSRS